MKHFLHYRYYMITIGFRRFLNQHTSGPKYECGIKYSMQCVYLQASCERPMENVCTHNDVMEMCVSAA